MEKDDGTGVVRIVVAAGSGPTQSWNGESRDVSWTIVAAEGSGPIEPVRTAPVSASRGSKKRCGEGDCGPAPVEVTRMLRWGAPVRFEPRLLPEADKDRYSVNNQLRRQLRYIADPGP